jgi:hypothetical protein
VRFTANRERSSVSEARNIFLQALNRGDFRGFARDAFRLAQILHGLGRKPGSVITREKPGEEFHGPVDPVQRREIDHALLVKRLGCIHIEARIPVQDDVIGVDRVFPAVFPAVYAAEHVGAFGGQFLDLLPQSGHVEILERDETRAVVKIPGLDDLEKFLPRIPESLELLDLPPD